MFEFETNPKPVEDQPQTDVKTNNATEQMRHATTTTVIEQTKTAVAKSDNMRHNTQ